MFHVKDGLFFERIDSAPGIGVGAVRIIKRQNGADESPVIFETVIDHSSWASVVASMCALGEDGTTHAMFDVLQTGGRVDDTWLKSQPPNM